MTGRFLNGLVIVLVLGLGLTSSYVIDDPYPSEKEMETIDDMTDEMEKLDGLNARKVDNQQLQLQADGDISANVLNEIRQKYNAIRDQCEKEASSKTEKLKEKLKGQKLGISKHHYQDLIHLKKSIAEIGAGVKAFESEACSACVLEELCDENPQEILTRLGIDFSSFGRRRQQRECKSGLLELAPKLFPPEDEEDVNCDPDDPFRTSDGTCNNLGNPLFGSAGDVFRRLLPPDYGDCVSTLRTDDDGNELPNTRNVSRFVHDGNEENASPESTTLTHLTMNFAQFLDHDITLAEAQGLECEPDSPNPECINIKVPVDDSSFRDRSVREFELERDAPHRQPKGCKLIVREHTNTITAFIDGSNVYGSSEEEAADLRDNNGLLKTMKAPHGCPMMKLLPPQDPDLFCVSKDPNRPCFLAGDERANENPGLASVHTIFVREHNRIAKVFNQITDWDAERIYQETRRIIGAVLQRIVYKEFLPLILSKKIIKDNDLDLLSGTKCSPDYDPALNAQMSSAFSVAAYRFGHSLIRNFEFSRLSQGAFEHSCDDDKEFLPIPILDFGNPTYLYDKCQGGVDSIFRGLVGEGASEPDGFFSPAVQNNLFRGEGDLSDLVAINLRRGHERGVPSYTAFRNSRECRLGRPRVRSFDDLLTDGFTSETVENLRIYKNVEDIDLFTGIHLEPKNPDGGVLGVTFQCLLAEQFKRLKEGDRFWHENCADAGTNTDQTAFKPCQLKEIRKANLAKIICTNSDDIPAIQKKALEQSKIFVPCCELPEIDLEKYVTCGAAENVAADQGIDIADEARHLHVDSRRPKNVHAKNVYADSAKW